LKSQAIWQQKEMPDIAM